MPSATVVSVSSSVLAPNVADPVLIRTESPTANPAELATVRLMALVPVVQFADRAVLLVVVKYPVVALVLSGLKTAVMVCEPAVRALVV